MFNLRGMKKSVIVGILVIPVMCCSMAVDCDNSTAKIVEPYDDASVSQHLTGPAEVGSMPDGFNNWAGKCDDHGHRVFTTFHSDSPYAGIAVISDPTCPGYKKGQP